MVLLSPVLAVDFTRFVYSLIETKPSLRTMAGGFALGIFFLLLMSFAQVFTTVYDYIPVVGPWFRDQFWLVFLVGGVILFLSFLLTYRLKDDGAPAAKYFRPIPVMIIVVLLAIIPIGVFLEFLFGGPQNYDSNNPPPVPTTLRILTFNIQQGYDANGQKNFEGQLQAIRQLNPDMIALQESDTARVANGNSDVVRFLADRLNMNAYYGPKTVTGTFGIALLSRYPFENPQTFFMYSIGEQTASLSVPIQVGQKKFNILVTHLGNDGPMIQQQQVLQRLDGLTNVIAMGDFNFRPDSDQYRLTLQNYEDAWTVAASQVMPTGETPAGQIDHVFLSPGMKVGRAEVVAPGPSDHPMLVVDISW
jgi:endonuclease/exonuclease/phosphatase family metal-dependent hydrolase